MQDDFKRFLVKKIKTTLYKTGLDSGEISGSLQELESLSDDLQTLAGLLRQTESPGDNFFLQEEAELSLEGNPEEPGNLLIEGDNLTALKLLAETHRAKIDVIYIDPPYNTGKRVFIYDDKFTGKQNDHGPWLSFMGSRLYAAKNLLSPEGVIFISIDDNEHCRLKILCDDIFGENNFVGTIIHQRAKGGGQAKHIVRGHDYILVYASRIEAVSLSRKKVVQKKTCIINGEQYIKNNDFLRKSFGKYTKTSDRRCFYEEIEQYKGKVKKEEIDKKLCNVKICDPAIGSGAFPMGLLRELFFCRSAIEPNIMENAAKIKRHIIQNNIYGVDIERGAVDIARLRFWLSLIVDEKSPEALPNLDFKIMQGNSLLEQYKGADLSTMTDKKVTAEGITLFDSMLDVYRKNLRDKLSEYYACPEHDKKVQLRKDISDIVKQELMEQGIHIDFEGIDLSANSQFFLWHTWFHDVFSRPSKEGFDIVIGNPPYGAKYDNQTKRYYKNTYVTANSIQGLQKGSLDTYTLFIT